MTRLKKIGLWILWTVGSLLALWGIIMQRQARRTQKNMTKARFDAVVKAADKHAAEAVEHAKRTGNLADHLRRDGAGQR